MGAQWKQAGREASAHKKGQMVVKLVREIMVAAKMGGPDPDLNARLTAAVDKAKKASVTKDTIERAIKKGAGGEADTTEALTYEGYGPGGCALIIEAFTSNRNKAAAEIKHILSKNGGSLATQGAAAWAFTKSEEEGWVPNSTIPLSDEDGAILSTIIEELEANDEVQDVYTNAD